MILLRQQIMHLLGRQSASRRLPTLLLQGETGTGKGLLARAVHNASTRSSQPFIDADCLAIPETLLEAELFGFERGAFTDAKQSKLGLFQAASGGSIFLDEVGLLPRTFQAKLLKVVEERGVRRLGSTHVDVLDLWVIAATNVDLATATRQGSFREDLYHRLAAMTLFMPPLRERGGDILLLAEHYLGRACAEYHLPQKVLTTEAQAALLAYAWPGNVRELANMLERVALLSGDVSIITADLLGLHQPAGPAMVVREPERSHLKVSVEGFEREKLRAALRETGWNVSLAAVRLGLPRNTLRYRIAKLQIHPGKSGTVLAPERKPPGKVGEKSRKVGAGAPAWTDGARQPRRGVYLGASVSQVGADPGRVSRVLKSVADKVRRFGGTVEAMTGAELLAGFGFDDSMEDGASCAANAALAVQKAGADGYQDGTSPLTVQLAIHASTARVRGGDGTPETTGGGQRPGGAAIGIVLERSEPQSILVAADVARLLPAQFDLEPVTVPGDGRDPLYRLVGRRRAGGHAPGKPLAPFVGREHELAMLDALLDQVEQGQGRAGGIVGEAGIGKSRLLREFRQRAVQRGFVYRLVECASSNGAMVNDAMAQILHQAYGIAEGESSGTICKKVRHGMEDAGLDPDEWAPYLLSAAGVSTGTERLAGVSRETIRARTIEMLRRFAVERSRRAPLVIAIDDLHLAGRTAEEFLFSVSQELPRSRILLLTTYRPGYRLPWGDRPDATQFGLQPLSRVSSFGLLRSLLPASLQSNGLIHRILDTASGNPLFLEEFARGDVETQEAGDELRVTDAIQGALLPRMSRLSAGARRLLMIVSVIGDWAPVRLVEHALGRPRGLAPLLAEVRKLELLHEESRRGETVLQCNHPLMRRAVYESLPVEERRTLHAAVGATLEALHAGRLQEVYELLAYHYGRSADSVKANAYLPHLIQTAGRNRAVGETVAVLDHALKDAARLPAGAQRDRLLVGLVAHQAHPLLKLGRLEEARGLLLRHLHCFEALKDARLAGPFFLALAGAYGLLGEPGPAAVWLRRAAAESARSGDATTLAMASHGLALDCFWAGRFGEGIEEGRAAVDRLRKPRERWWTGQAMWGMSMNSIAAGNLEDAIEVAAAASEAARDTGDPRLECFTGFAKGWAHALRGDWEAGIAACRRAVELAPDPLATAVAQAWLGAVCLEMDDPAQAADVLVQAYDKFRGWKCRPLHALVCAWLSDALLGQGHAERALELAEEGRALSDELGFPLAGALARRALGRIARARGALAEAEGHLEGARQVFHSIGAAYEAARTLLDLAATTSASGRPDAAAIHLAAAQREFSDLKVPFYAGHAAKLADNLRGAAQGSLELNKDV
jgi:transcriptional regulator with AAA-type ATPase domain/tetratricopeptide (TPR) repeat protein